MYIHTYILIHATNVVPAPAEKSMDIFMIMVMD